MTPILLKLSVTLVLNAGPILLPKALAAMLAKGVGNGLGIRMGRVA